MQTKYCFKPDQGKFLAFLNSVQFTSQERFALKLFHVEQIRVDNSSLLWELHYKSNADIPETLTKKVASALKDAFSLNGITIICDTNGKELVQNSDDPEYIITDCTGEPLQDDIPLPEEPPMDEYAPADPCCEMPPFDAPSEAPLEPEMDPNYIRAMENLYGEKKDESMLWGKKVKAAKARPLNSLVEEENNIVIEGTFVKTYLPDGSMESFVEKETKTGNIILSFSLYDGEGGITVKKIFSKPYNNNRGNYGGAPQAEVDPKKDAKEFKNLLKIGMKLRIQGNLEFDKFTQEYNFRPIGIQKLPSENARMDNADIKRVELHCHTKMSKLDAVTPMKDLVKQAIKWGHKALAITDHGVVQAFPFCFDEVMDEKSDLKLIYGMEGYLMADKKVDDSLEQETGDVTKKTKAPKMASYHIIILAKNETGLRNLYKLVSISHLRYLYKRPLLPRKVIEEHREGLILGSACEAGELYRAILAGASDEELERIASFYDYLEIQPIENNMFLVREKGYTVNQLVDYNKKIYELGKKMGKLVVGTCDVHFLNPEDAKYRAILQAGQNYKDADEQPPLYFRTTEEMLASFAYLGEEAAYEVCVTNTNKVADMVERFVPVPDRDQLYSPFIPGAEEAVHDMSYAKAHAWYGEVLPEIVEERLKMELNSIIGNGFAVLYYIAHKLVKHSIDRGYLVGSRGSVGSSFVATMLDITEVNPLKPHYRCTKCRHSEFFMNNEVDSGFDLPPKDCPVCGTPMFRDGHEIPFAVFLGFDGDKVPDIDLNFSGGIDPDDPLAMSDQSVAHKYTEELFGRDNVCRAGTVATVAAKTAAGFVRKYFEERNMTANAAVLGALVPGIEGVKRTTGQHPGGIMVVPRNMDIHYITPMNRPADDREETTITTHYDYHSINDRLVKLDILGHDDPMVLKMLENYMQYDVDPNFCAKNIPVGDAETMQIFQGTESLGVTPEQIDSTVGTFGIPECGTKFVRQMIDDVKPKNFSEVVRVSGYSHGTDVWLNNAQDLIRQGIPVKETVSTRDDIMTYLIAKGVKPKLAFKTMEYCRKGKAAKKGLEPEMREAMTAAGIPEYYMKSCETLNYLFPKAHAVAYVLMAYRIAYCKVHYPKHFYAAYFTVRAKDFDYVPVSKGLQYVKNTIRNLYNLGTKASATEKSQITYLELANEMMERGLKFEKIDLYKSHPIKFLVTEQGLLPPLASLGGLGEVAAKNIADHRDAANPFISQEDMRMRCGIGKSSVELLANNGILDGLPESNQISLF